MQNAFRIHYTNKEQTSSNLPIYVQNL